MFFLIGIALFGIGLLGEYIGRIYQQVRHRPRYLVEAVLEEAASEKPKAKRVKKTAGDEVSPSLFSDDQA
jgi:undecaprenyl-phosphate 4-deoxy-4-formamido-L-arabinose transferase